MNQHDELKSLIAEYENSEMNNALRLKIYLASRKYGTKLVSGYLKIPEGTIACWRKYTPEFQKKRKKTREYIRSKNSNIFKNQAKKPKPQTQPQTQQTDTRSILVNALGTLVSQLSEPQVVQTIGFVQDLANPPKPEPERLVLQRKGPLRVNSKSLVIHGLTFSSITEAEKAYGLGGDSIGRRVREGHNLDEVLPKLEDFND